MVSTGTAAFSREQGVVPWWVGLLHGCAGSVAGALLIASAGNGGEALLQPLGWYWTAAGVLGLVRAFVDHTLWGVRLTSAVLALVLGTWILESPVPVPVSPAAAYVWTVGLLAIVLGAAEVVEASGGGQLSLYGLGVLDLLIGIVLVFDPLPRVDPAMLLGIASMAVGAATVSVALGARWPRQQLVPGPLAQAGENADERLPR